MSFSGKGRSIWIALLSIATLTVLLPLTNAQELALSPGVTPESPGLREIQFDDIGCLDLLRRADSILLEAGNSEHAMVDYRKAARCAEDTAVIKKDALVKLALVSMCDGYYLDALNTLDEIADKASISRDTALLSIAVHLIANTYLRADDSEKARIYIDSAEVFAGGAPDSLVRLVNTYTATAMLRNGIPLARVNVPDSFDLPTPVSRPINSGNYRGLAELNSAMIALHLDEPQIALYYLVRCINSDPDREILRNGYKQLAILSSQQGNFEDAFSYMTQYSQINNDLLNAKRQEMLGRLRIQMETYKHREEITELTRDRNIATIMNRMQRINAFSLLVGSLVILIAAYLTIRNYQKRLYANQVIHQQNEEINKQRITDLENNMKIQSMNSMIVGQEAERERIARELHDSLGGLLSTIKLHFDALQSHNEQINASSEYTKAYSLLDEACTEVRNISNNMQPGALLKLGVVSAIGDLINRLQGEETPQIDYQHFDVKDDIDQTKALNIYRIVQELLNNSLKHANASHILVQLVQKEDELIITVEDDGIGYDPATVTPGMGTENLASRVNYVKGDIHVHSVPGEGTSTLITLPV